MHDKPVLGIDISKRKFNVALLLNGKCYNKIFSNDLEGFTNLATWLNDKKANDVHACMEATGCYSEPLATYLFENKIDVSMVNPLRVKGFAQTQLVRTKNDKIDAKIIAQFCLTIQPSLWKPLPEYKKTLQALVKRLDSLIDMQTQELNRQQSSSSLVANSISEMLEAIHYQIEQTKKQIHNFVQNHDELKRQAALLESVKGLGERTITRILAFIDTSTFKNAKQVVAFVGLNPRQFQSGSSVNYRTRISKTGNKDLRKALYFPSIVAMQFNPEIRMFYERLKKAGKPTMVIICAIMRKLLHIVFGVLKSGVPYKPGFNNNEFN